MKSFSSKDSMEAHFRKVHESKLKKKSLRIATDRLLKTQCRKTQKILREINFLVNLFCKTADFTKFLPKKCGREFRQFPHWVTHSMDITEIFAKVS